MDINQKMIENGKNCKTTILYLSDQQQYRNFSEIQLKAMGTDSSIVLTRPIAQKKNVRNFCGDVFTDIFHWKDVLAPDFNPFKDSFFSNEQLFQILDEAHWPQTLDEVLASDQFSHTSVSGRFYQGKYNKNYLKNAFAISFEVTRQAILLCSPLLIFTDEIRDVNKLGAVCAALVANVPLFLLESTNINDLLFIKRIQKGDHQIESTYFGITNNSLSPVFSCYEKLCDGILKIDWSLLAESEKIGIRPQSDSICNDTMRSFHKERWGIGQPINVRVELGHAKRLLKTLFNRIVRVSSELNRVEEAGIIPLHQKNKLHYLQSHLGKPLYHLLCRIRSIRDRKILNYRRQLNVAVGAYSSLCLHYFPEASTIGGTSWRNVKHELDLLSIPSVYHFLTPSETIIFEHPVYLIRGERPSSFWKSLHRLGYKRQVRRSLGINLHSPYVKKIVSITGSVALEAALAGKKSILVKNSILLNIQNVNHIIAELDVNDWQINVERQIPATLYRDICYRLAIKRSSLTPSHLVGITNRSKQR